MVGRAAPIRGRMPKNPPVGGLNRTEPILRSGSRGGGLGAEYLRVRASTTGEGSTMESETMESMARGPEVAGGVGDVREHLSRVWAQAEHAVDDLVEQAKG